MNIEEFLKQVSEALSNDFIDFIPFLIPVIILLFVLSIGQDIIKCFAFDLSHKDMKKAKTKVIKNKNIVSENIIDHEEDSPIKDFY